MRFAMTWLIIVLLYLQGRDWKIIRPCNYLIRFGISLVPVTVW
jgi:hypothetical protein